MIKASAILQNSCNDYARRHLVDGVEKRKHRRLGASFDLSCRKAGAPTQKLYAGRTVNVGPGGLYFETTEAAFEPGNLAEVRLSVPPTSGLLELGGTICGLARVVRTENLRGSGIAPQSRAVQGVAVEFCRALKLRI
jgi:hypothetical protein